MLEIKKTLTQSPKQKPDQQNLGFGKSFSDHMVTVDYTEGVGWHNAQLVPYGDITLDPAAMVFHYGQELFEGMKAYPAADGRVLLFRPEKNGQIHSASPSETPRTAGPGAARHTMRKDFVQ